MKEFIKRNIKFIILVIVCMIGSFISSAFATNGLFDSKQVDYDNSNSHIISTNVGDAIDEVFQHATDYNEIKTAIGNSNLTTTNKTLTGAVNELNNYSVYNVIGTSAIVLPENWKVCIINLLAKHPNESITRFDSYTLIRDNVDLTSTDVIRAGHLIQWYDSNNIYSTNIQYTKSTKEIACSSFKIYSGEYSSSAKVTVICR